jgi:hypothetical protein
VSHVVEHELRRQAPQQVGAFGDLGAVQVELQMPAEGGDAFRQRLDHVPADDGVGAACQREAYSTYSGRVECFQLRVGDGRMDDRNASAVRSQLRQRVDRHPIIGRIVARGHDDDARRSSALLEEPIVLHRGIVRLGPARAMLRKARIVDVHVAVGGIGRGLYLGRLGAGRVRHRRLRTALAGLQRAVCGQCRSSGQKGPTTDGLLIHGASPVISLRSRFDRKMG